MYILGIDWGEKYIGIALSDKNGRVAGRFSVERNNDQFYPWLNNLLAEYDISTIVVGIPFDVSGEESSIALNIHDFVKPFENKYKVVFWNETLTSRESQSIRVKKGVSKGRLDDLSAQLILQEYLDYMSSQ